MGGLSSDKQDPAIRHAGLAADPVLRTDTINLLARAKGGDDEALGELCSRYLPQLRRWAAGRISPRMRRVVDTSDLVQQVLLEAITRLEDLRLRRPGSFPAYLRKTLLSRIYNESLRSARRPDLGALDDNFADSSPSPLDDAIGQDVQERYETAMMRLQEMDRAAVFLRLELGIPYLEIASVLKKPSADAARKTVARAIVRLGEELGHGT